MRRRTALVLAAVTAAAGTAIAVPATARLVLAEPAGAVTTIETSSSGTAEIVLYDDAVVSPLATHNPDVSISGAGRMVAFELTRADGGADELYGVRLPSFAGGAVTVGGSASPASTCTPWPSAQVPVQEQCGAPHPTSIRLHEGYYHLVVVTDGKPVRISLRLHGQQRRSAALHLQQQIRTLEANLPERESVGSTTVSYGTSVGFQNATQASDPRRRAPAPGSGDAGRDRLCPRRLRCAAAVCVLPRVPRWPDDRVQLSRQHAR